MKLPHFEPSNTGRVIAYVLIMVATAYGFVRVDNLAHQVKREVINRVEQNTQQIKTTQREQCVQVDADHNRERARILTSERLLYSVPAFKVLISSPRAEHVAYSTAKKNYNDVRKTRPSYCLEYSKNRVKDFPSLADFREGRMKSRNVSHSKPSQGSGGTVPGPGTP